MILPPLSRGGRNFRIRHVRQIQVPRANNAMQYIRASLATVLHEAFDSIALAFSVADKHHFACGCQHVSDIVKVRPFAYFTCIA